MLALRDAREARDMLAIVARGLARDFGRPCVAYEVRERTLRPVAMSEVSGERAARVTDEFDLSVLRLRVVVRRDREDLIALAADGQLRAVVALEDAGEPLADEDVKHLRAIAAHASLALSSALAFEQLRRYAAEGAALTDAARTILGFTELEPLAEALCRLGMRLGLAQRAGVYAARETSLARIGYAVLEGVEPPPESLPLGEADARAALAEAFAGRSFVASRLLLGVDDGADSRLGLLVVARPQPFERAEQRLIDALVTLAALAIRNVELYEQATRVSRALAESNAFKDDLMAMFAHDFRGPLTVISGFSELLLETQDAAVRRSAQTIMEQTRRLAKLSEDALALAATQSAGFSLQRAHEDIAEFVREAVAPLDRDGRIVLEAPLEPVVVSFDRSRLRHVLDNVVGNALKYSTDPIRIRIAALEEGVRIDVIDTGIGIPPDDFERVFTRFGRAANARSRGIAGSGVGLYVAKKIVDVHGGRLDVSSEEDQGSTFSIVLPA